MSTDPRAPAARPVRWYPYFCPICEGEPNGCLVCHGTGVIDEAEARAWLPEDLRPTPRPPGVMPRACVGCAFRADSPERDHGDGLFDRRKPFWCHRGMPLIAGTYTPVLQDGAGLPVGALVCGGWWDWMTTGALPEGPWREDAGDDQVGRDGDSERVRPASGRG